MTTRQDDRAIEGLNLHAGEWVEVRSADEILATLDATKARNGMPFMPEMLQYCGKRFRVYKSAHKTCDTVENYIIRTVDNAVHLEGAGAGPRGGMRCDGSGHDGCQAKCLIFWNDAWLKRVPDGGTEANAPSSSDAGTVPAAAWDELVHASRYRIQEAGSPSHTAKGEQLYRCQATDLLNATKLVRRRERWDPRLYIKDVTSGNVTLGEFILYGTRAMFQAFTRTWFNWRYPTMKGLAGEKTPTVNLNMQPGELVQVRTKDEIMRTLSPQLRNRGLWFDIEMVAYCNATFRVLDRVEKLVDEKTGRMVRMPTPGLILDGVICTGHNSVDRMFCPREIYPYWREIWLKRVDESSAPAPVQPRG